MLKIMVFLHGTTITEENGVDLPSFFWSCLPDHSKNLEKSGRIDELAQSSVPDRKGIVASHAVAKHALLSLANGGLKIMGEKQLSAPKAQAASASNDDCRAQAARQAQNGGAAA